jgi:hypothetical protein
MHKIQLMIALKEKSKVVISFVMFCTFSVSSLNILAETGAMPSKGMTQNQVKAHFGEPLSIKNAVGKPPITRWDYQDYSVYFESTYVIHSFYHHQVDPAQASAKIPVSKVEPVSDTKITNEEAPIIEETPVIKAPVIIEAKENITQEEAPVEVEKMIIEEIEVEKAKNEESATEESAVEKSTLEETSTQETDFGKWGS